jgi:hypothetical protein
MAGYEVEDTTYTLEFDDRPGAEIVCRAGSMEQHFEALSLDWTLERGALQKRYPDDDEAQEREVRRLYTIFVDHIESWNLTRRKAEVPITVDGLLSLDREFVRTAALAWLRGVFGLSAPLEKRSTDTEKLEFDESSIPMEVIPSSLPLAS